MAMILDLETIGAPDVAVEPVSAPANYRDPQKIADYIADAEAAQRTRAALHPWTAQIVCLGYIDVEAHEHALICRTEDEERTALAQFWAALLEQDGRFVRPVIGFNHRAFDLPVLLARSLLLGVSAPSLNLDRYRTPHIDLLDKLTFYGTVPARSLTWFARRFGLEVTDTTRGSDIAACVAAGDYEAVRAHNLSDLRLTKALAERTGWLRGMKAVA